MNTAGRLLTVLAITLSAVAAQATPSSVPLAGGVATLEVPPGMRFLDAAATAPIREGIWGNAPDATVIGMLVRDGLDPRAADRWAVTVHWQPIGWVATEEWTALDGDALLAAWRAQTDELNQQRAARNEQPIEILALASPPRSDPQRATAFWAKRYRIAGDELIACESRAFGRDGIVVLKATGTPDLLAELAAASEAALARVSFAPGRRHADHVAGDKTGTLATAGLIARGVWDQMSTMQRILLGVLAASALFALIRFVARLFG